MMDMENMQYLSPSIGMAMPMLDEQLDQLTQEALKRGIAAHIKKRCESDPELADIIMEKKKTLPRCIRYVLEKAQQSVATNVEAMLETEFKQLAETKVRGLMAAMAGSAVSEEQIYKWADEYLYGGAAVEPSDAKKNKRHQENRQRRQGRLRSLQDGRHGKRQGNRHSRREIRV